MSILRYSMLPQLAKSLLAIIPVLFATLIFILVFADKTDTLNVSPLSPYSRMILLKTSSDCNIDDAKDYISSVGGKVLKEDGDSGVILVKFTKKVQVALLSISPIIESIGPIKNVNVADKEVKVSEKVKKKTEDGGKVNVIISFSDPVAIGAQKELRKAAVEYFQDEILQGLPEENFELKNKFKYTPAISGLVTKEGIESLENNPIVKSVRLVNHTQVISAESVPLLKADIVHNEPYELRGKGMTVAILDTGADTDHPDFTFDSAIEDEKCFTSDIYDGQEPPNLISAADCQGTDPTEGDFAEDFHGHGTNVAGIVTAPNGFAPEAGIIPIRVTNDAGFGSESDWIRALEWILANQEDLSVDIINISMEVQNPDGTGIFYNNHTTCDNAYPAIFNIIDNLANLGVVVFAGTGNRGSQDGISSPACLSNVIAVGATYDSDLGREPDAGTYKDPGTGNPDPRWGDCYDDPSYDAANSRPYVTCFTNISASLENIIMAAGAKIMSTNLGGGQSEWSGTSQASPAAAGVGALMLQMDKNSSNTQVKELMQATGNSVYTNGNDEFKLINAELTIEGAIATECQSITDIPKVECMALKRLYDSTGGGSWANNTDWLVTNTACSWYGITCTENHVTGINLSSNNLAGNIAEELQNLKQMVILNLNDNQLSGVIPGQIGNLSSLQVLNLGINRLGNNVPKHLGGLINLTLFDISSNKLSGDMPIEITNLTNLTSADFGYNMLTASDPGLITFLGTKDPDWNMTQTIPPINIHLPGTFENNGLTVYWDPISYQSDPGHYQVNYATTPGGPYTSGCTTTNKTESSCEVLNLSANTTYYFVIRTYTQAHGVQQNNLLSKYSTEVEHTTPLIRYVSDDGNCGGAAPCYTSIQSAVDEATSGELIKVSAGLYTGGLGQVVHISKGVTMAGGYSSIDWGTYDPTINETIIDAESIVDRRGITIDGMGEGVLTIKGITVRNGNLESKNGGGIYVSGGNVILEDVKITNNKAGTYNPAGFYGGGIYLEKGDITLINSLVETNSSDRYGGGVYVSEHVNAAIMSGNEIRNNQADYGGGLGIENAIADFTVQNNLIENNAGGGIYIDRFDNEAGIIYINDNVIRNNQTSEIGGGMYISHGNYVIQNNTIDGNQTYTQGGGGVFIDYVKSASFDDNVIKSNITLGTGGGIAIRTGGVSNINLHNNKILGNTSSRGGGGIDLLSSSLEGIMNMTNDVIGNNSVEDLYSWERGGIVVNGGKLVGNHLTIVANGGYGIITKQSEEVELKNSLITGHFAGVSGTGITADYVLFHENGENCTEGAVCTHVIEGDPIFVNEGAENYHLSAGSAAVDKGIDVGVRDDMDGETRFMGNAPELGADEIFDNNPPSTSPFIEILEPDGNERANGQFKIEWLDFDVDDNADISLFYDTDNMGEDGIPIVSGLSEDDEGSGDTYTWDISLIPEGDYYIYAVINDGINPPITNYSDGALTIFHSPLTLFVSPDGTCGGASPCYSDIQDAIDGTIGGDVIKIAAGIYTGGTRQVIFVNKGISIAGGYSASDWETYDPAANETIIDAENVTDRRGITIQGSWSGTLTIKGITAKNGIAGSKNGGGIYVAGGNVSLEDIKATNNSSLGYSYLGYGGGIHIEKGDIAIINSVIESNSANTFGGGLYIGNDVGSAMISGNEIRSNQVEGDGGAGLASENGIASITIQNNVIENNSSTFGLYVNGGGIYLDQSAGGSGLNPISVINNIIRNNQSSAYGGGMYVYRGNYLIQNNSIESNQSMGSGYGDGGGGMFISNINSAIVDNNLVKNNITEGNGGGILVEPIYSDNPGGLYFRNNKISGNSSEIGAGGIGLMETLSGPQYFNEVHMINDVISDNATVHEGGGIIVKGGKLAGNHLTVVNNGNYGIKAEQSGQVEIKNSIVAGHTEAGISGAAADYILFDDNGKNCVGREACSHVVEGDPMFVDWLNGDYHLNVGSAGVDKGIETGAAEDMDGEARPMGNNPDLGADELFDNNPPSPVPFIEILKPGFNDRANEQFGIEWIDYDADNDAAISLFYDTDSTGQDGIPIVYGLSEDDESLGDTYVWDTSAIPEGDYFIYSVINDGVNPTFTDYSDGALTISHNPLTLYVASDGNCGGMVPCYSSIQAALDETIDGDEIKVATGIYTGTYGQVAHISSGVTLAGGYTASDWDTYDPITNETIVDAENISDRRGITIEGIWAGTLTTKGLTVRNGNVATKNGGGIYVAGGNVNIEDVKITNNTSSRYSINYGCGGGISAEAGEVTIMNSVIESNSAYEFGGGIYIGSYISSAVISGNEIRSNQVAAGGGAGLASEHGTAANAITIQNNLIENNSYASGGYVDGGGLYTYQFAGGLNPVNIINNIIRNNQTNSYGGGIYAYRGNYLVKDNTIESNQSMGGGYFDGGGGMFISGINSAVIDNNSVKNNITEGTGGGIAVSLTNWGGSSIYINNNEIFENTSERGGGVAFLPARQGALNESYMTNNVITNNIVTGEGGIVIMNENKLIGKHLTIANNGTYGIRTEQLGEMDIYNSIITGHTIAGMSGGGITGDYNLFNGNGNTCEEGAVCNNNFEGHPAFVDESNLDYHLSVGSKAIDRGTGVEVTEDIDGESRPMGNAPDLGADEFPSIACSEITEIPLTECQAIYSLYNSTKGIDWTNNSGWLQTVTPCNWHGIACSAGHVTDINLNYNNLDGNIPPELQNLPYLGNVYLASNSLSGSIPPEIGSFGSGSLLTLNLSNNKLEGEIPIDLTYQSTLDGLDLGYNKLESNNQVIADFLAIYDNNWNETQTIPPTQLNLGVNYDNSMKITLHPITYQSDAGYYQLSYSTAQGGSYNTVGCQTLDKAGTECTTNPVGVETMYYFVIQAFTPAHTGQPNDLWSRESEEFPVYIIPNKDVLITKIAGANSSGLPEIFYLSPQTHQFDLTAGIAGEEANGLPTVTGDITLIGSDASVKRDDVAENVPYFRIFNVAPSGKLKLVDLNIINGEIEQGSGAGIKNEGELILDTVSLSQNIADSGGAVENSGNATITNSTIMYNLSFGSGGGIKNAEGASLTITGSRINENIAGSGGGGIQNEGTLTVDNTEISSNLGASGGGISSGGSVTLSGTQLTDNATIGPNLTNDPGADICDHNDPYKGGGICNYGALNVTGSIIQSNASITSGGGLYNDSTAGITVISNSCIISNAANINDAIKNESSNSLDAAGNWWGYANAPTPAGIIGGNVDTSSPLADPILDCPSGIVHDEISSVKNLQTLPYDDNEYIDPTIKPLGELTPTCGTNITKGIYYRIADDKTLAETIIGRTRIGGIIGRARIGGMIGRTRIGGIIGRARIGGIIGQDKFRFNVSGEDFTPVVSIFAENGQSILEEISCEEGLNNLTNLDISLNPGINHYIIIGFKDIDDGNIEVKSESLHNPLPVEVSGYNLIKATGSPDNYYLDLSLLNVRDYDLSNMQIRLFAGEDSGKAIVTDESAEITSIPQGALETTENQLQIQFTQTYVPGDAITFYVEITEEKTTAEGTRSITSTVPVIVPQKLKFEFWDFDDEQEIAGLPAFPPTSDPRYMDDELLGLEEYAVRWIEDIDLPYSEYYSLTREKGGELSEQFYNRMAGKLTGYFKAEYTGTYLFYLTVEDGAKLLIGGNTVINGTGARTMGDGSVIGNITLAEGWHKIEIHYFEDLGGNGLKLEYKDPIMSAEKIIPSRLFRSNSAPSIQIVEPDGSGDLAEDNFTIMWTDSNPDDDASISLYYDTDTTGEDGILITSGLSENDSANLYNWDTSLITEGTYYIYAVIDDGITPPVISYSNYPLLINRQGICPSSLCNGDFESTPDLEYWTPGNGTNQIVTDIVHDGAKSFYTEHPYDPGQNPRWSGIWQTVMVESAQTYGLTGFYQSENAAQGHIKVIWKNTEGTVLQVDYPVINMSGTNTSWIEFSKLVIAPAGAFTAEIKIWHGVNTSSQNVLGSKLWTDSLAFEVATTACGTLCNESFEHGILYWIQSGAVGSHTIEQPLAHEGSKILRSEQQYVSSDPVKWAGVTQYAQVKEGTTYRLRVWLKTENAANGHVRIRWRDSGGNLLSTLYPITGVRGSDSLWFKRESNVTAPANAARAELAIWHGVTTENIRGSTLWVDDITMICQNLCNGGFEDGNIHWETNGKNEGEVVLTDIQEGARALKIVQSLDSTYNAQWAGVSQRFMVSGGISYDLDFWMKKENIVQGHVKIKWRDSNDQLILQEFPIAGINGTNLTWDQLSTTLTAPANAETAEVFIWHGVDGTNQNASGSTMYLDNITFDQIP